VRTVTLDYPDALPLDERRLHALLRCRMPRIPVARFEQGAVRRGNDRVNVALDCDEDDGRHDAAVAELVAELADQNAPRVRQAPLTPAPRHVDPYEAVVRAAYPPDAFVRELEECESLAAEGQVERATFRLAFLDLLVRILLKR
jgi:hypothetical protein